MDSDKWFFIKMGLLTVFWVVSTVSMFSIIPALFT